MSLYKTFDTFGFSKEINTAINELGFTTPTPIQQETIPYLLSGEDVIGQAQTGTGKTAAFGLPILSLIDKDLMEPQAIIMVPTRELAVQVTSALSDFAKYIRGVKVAAIYGGDSYTNQIRMLRNGAQIIVGTPGRIMDHMRRETVNFATITKVVLDEADEMLKMGFIDDITWILEQLPARNHTTLFSATMPKPIRKIAIEYLNNPKEVVIQATEKQAANIKQLYLIAANKNKFTRLARILEVSEVQSVIIFTKTKALTEDVTALLVKNNFSACALNGDMPQAARKKTIDRVKCGNIRILVATDVAARGLDIDCISHVINYDAPHDLETYVHRIGRTGRAGRTGTAILFLTPNEKRMLNDIEFKTKQRLEEIDLPSDKAINELRLNKYKALISNIINVKANMEKLDKREVKAFELFTNMIDEMKTEFNVSGEEIAIAMAMLRHKENPILVEHAPQDSDQSSDRSERHNPSNQRSRSSGRGDRNDRPRSGRSGGFGSGRGERSSNSDRGFGGRNSSGSSDRSERPSRSSSDRGFGNRSSSASSSDRSERPSRSSSDRGFGNRSTSGSSDRSERPSRSSSDRGFGSRSSSSTSDRSERPSRSSSERSFGGRSSSSSSDRSERPSRSSSSSSDRSERPSRSSSERSFSGRSSSGDRSERPNRSSSSDRSERPSGERKFTMERIGGRKTGGDAKKKSDFSPRGKSSNDKRPPKSYN